MRRLFLDARIFWHCPEIRGLLAKNIACRTVKFFLAATLVLFFAPVIILRKFADGMDWLNRALWGRPVRWVERSIVSTTKGAHDILPAHEIRKRLKKGAPP